MLICLYVHLMISKTTMKDVDLVGRYTDAARLLTGAMVWKNREERLI